MKIKTNELTGAALDWAVAKCEGTGTYFDANNVERRTPLSGYAPSIDWSQGGPIIEREGIAVSPEIDCIRWYGSANGFFLDGPTPLIAAMRCYVASKLGDEVEVPEELS